MSYRVLSNSCNCCGICVNACPIEAISYREGSAYIDPKQCLDCGSCESECPIGLIVSSEY